MTDITYYTFIYCLYHDDGYIYKSNKIYSDYKSYCGTNCESKCDLSVMGILSYDEIKINEIQKINKCYNRYGGGFKFKYYLKNIIDENDNNLDIEECSELKKYLNIDNI
jgi:hypothetical protein